jgi:hypothetical protein
MTLLKRPHLRECQEVSVVRRYLKNNIVREDMTEVYQSPRPNSLWPYPSTFVKHVLSQQDPYHETMNPIAVPCERACVHTFSWDEN